MVAFIVIGVHNWQTTAQGQPSGGSWRPVSSSSHSGRRGGCWGCWSVERGGRWGGERRGEKPGGARWAPSPLICCSEVGLFVITPTPHRLKVLPVYVHLKAHTDTNTHSECHKCGTLSFIYSKILIKQLAGLSPGPVLVKQTWSPSLWGSTD